MIVGIGVDMVRIDRFLPWVENPALSRRFFADAELAALEGRRDLAQALAVRFAAKEAFGKALGCGLRNMVLKDIQISQDGIGKPSLCLTGTAEKLFRDSGATTSHLSLSHDGNYGLAYVILEAGAEAAASEEKYAGNEQKKCE